jgi:hypothetical protein
MEKGQFATTGKMVGPRLITTLAMIIRLAPTPTARVTLTRMTGIGRSLVVSASRQGRLGRASKNNGTRHLWKD